MSSIQARIRATYFNMNKITAAVGVARARILWKQSLDLRDDAIRSIPNTFKTSRPFNPPSSHLGARHLRLNRLRKKKGLPIASRLRGPSRGIKWILTDYDTQTKSFVIGAPLFPAGGQPDNPVPGLLEHGGTGPRIRRSGKFHMKYSAPRPFMMPALMRAIGKGMANPWKDAIRP